MSAYGFVYELLKPREIFLVHAPDYGMYVNSDDVSVNCRLLIDGIWEPHTTALFRSLVGKGMVVADVGAHTGYYTLLASRLVGEDGLVFAFEPAPDNFGLLCQSIKANGFRNCVAIQKAVSDSEGICKLSLCAESAVGHALRKTSHSASFIETETVTLDAFFKDKGYKVDVIKVDAEGAEMAILRGMEKILDRNPDLIFFTEFLPRLIHEFGDSAKQYFERIAAYGFSIWHIDEEKRRIEALDLECLRDSQDGHPLKDNSENSVNLLCLRGEAAKRFYLLTASLPRCSAALSTNSNPITPLAKT
jgi:FkbM family methyltransferase